MNPKSRRKTFGVHHFEAKIKFCFGMLSTFRYYFSHLNKLSHYSYSAKTFTNK